VSGIVVSAGAVLRVADTGPAAARATLGTIAGSSRRATAAMRTLLGTLDDGQEAAPAGLGDLAELVEHARQTGCRVVLETGGDLGSVPADVGLSAYRIVQEGLTNALKHGGADDVTVRLQRTPTGLDIGVDDSGAGSAVPASVPVSGHGLVGMAERVALLGGALDHGPARDGGWSVRASLPLD
jgi:signal transduction histidine kinase